MNYQIESGTMNETEKTLTREQVIEKVKKLLTLSKSTDFEGEISAALNMARQLLAKYNLEMSDIETAKYNEESPQFKESGISKGHWQPRLARVMARYCNCHVFNQHNKLIFIGMPAELELCHFTFNLVAKQIDIMMRKKRKELRAEREYNTGRRQDRQASSFYTRGYSLGIIDKIDERLKERLNKEKEDNSDYPGMALVLVKHPKVESWCNANLKNAKPKRKRSQSERGYDLGFVDGDNVSLNKGIKGGSIYNIERKKS